MNPWTRKHPTIAATLNDSRLSAYRPRFCFESAKSRGAIVEVTSWTNTEELFGRAVAQRVKPSAIVQFKIDISN